MNKPKFLLDENVGAPVVASLRASGFDVVSVGESTPGAEDEVVLKQARKEKRVLVTLDKDFGALIFRDLKSHVGILFLRLQNERPENIIFVLKNVLAGYSDKLKNKFTTASETDIRIR